MYKRLQSVIKSAVNNGAAISWAPHYCEPGYSSSEAGIYFANWNPESFTPHVPTVESRIGALLEHYDIDIEWYDEWATCTNCGGAVRTTADSYGWKPAYVLWNDCEIVCESCALACMDDYESYLVNDPGKADTFDVDWSERGWRRINIQYETGLHPGQNDNPSIVFDKLTSTLDEPPDVLFSLDSTGQFDSNWSAWVRDPE